MLNNQTGFVLYQGASRIDGKPIVVVITHDSVNRKTGPMDQAWIMRSDIHPFHATRTGDDYSVCGDCAHRPANGNSCYVTVQHGPASVWRSFRDGKYPEFRGRQAELVMRGRHLRIGAYGDPAAVWRDVWEPLLGKLAGWTGYTSQWRTCDQSFKLFLMASVHTERDYVDAQLKGWRTYRIRTGPLKIAEVACPASAESGHQKTCQQCLLCSGLSARGFGARSIAIYPHGAPVAFYRGLQDKLEFERTDR